MRHGQAAFAASFRAITGIGGLIPAVIDGRLTANSGTRGFLAREENSRKSSTIKTGLPEKGTVS
jgi:hypothetical protein